MFLRINSYKLTLGFNVVIQEDGLIFEILFTKKVPYIPILLELDSLPPAIRTSCITIRYFIHIHFYNIDTICRAL
jgi:hypothetical protein